jgi:GT2 family glycosyltransferase
MLSPAIDIIIPIFNAYEDLQRCLDSVLRTTKPHHRIIMIDDCSTDSRIADYFEMQRSTADPRLWLLQNDTNLGFVSTVNRGMTLSHNDVVLLNSSCPSRLPRHTHRGRILHVYSTPSA